MHSPNLRTLPQSENTSVQAGKPTSVNVVWWLPVRRILPSASVSQLKARGPCISTCNEFWAHHKQEPKKKQDTISAKCLKLVPIVCSMREQDLLFYVSLSLVGGGSFYPRASSRTTMQIRKQKYNALLLFGLQKNHYKDAFPKLMTRCWSPRQDY